MTSTVCAAILELYSSKFYNTTSCVNIPTFCLISATATVLLLTEIKTEKFAYRYTLVRNWVHSSCILKDCLEVNTIEFYQVSNDCFFLCLVSREGPSDQTMETPMKLWLKNWLPRPFKLLSRIIERSRKVYRISLHVLRRNSKILAGSFHIVAEYLLWYNFIHGLYFFLCYGI